jgi:hypothetical protein
MLSYYRFPSLWILTFGGVTCQEVGGGGLSFGVRRCIPQNCNNPRILERCISLTTYITSYNPVNKWDCSVWVRWCSSTLLYIRQMDMFTCAARRSGKPWAGLWLPCIGHHLWSALQCTTQSLRSKKISWQWAVRCCVGCDRADTWTQATDVLLFVTLIHLNRTDIVGRELLRIVAANNTEEEEVALYNRRTKITPPLRLVSAEQDGVYSIVLVTTIELRLFKDSASTSHREQMKPLKGFVGCWENFTNQSDFRCSRTLWRVRNCLNSEIPRHSPAFVFKVYWNYKTTCLLQVLWIYFVKMLIIVVRSC